MKTTVKFSQFCHAFHSMSRYEQFGYDGLQVLFDYLEEYEESTGEELELDVIAMCCDYSHDTVQEIIQNYDIDISDYTDGICMASAYGLEKIENAKREAVRDYLESNTTICGETDSGFVYCSAF